jgi:hypothetical protein
MKNFIDKIYLVTNKNIEPKYVRVINQGKDSRGDDVIWFNKLYSDGKFSCDERYIKRFTAWIKNGLLKEITNKPKIASLLLRGL